MAVLLFIAKMMISGGLLYGYYHLFLRNQRFHHYNRFYLLAIALLSLIIPFINIPVSLLWNNRQHPVLIQTLKVITANGWEEPVTIYARHNQWSQWLNIQSLLYTLYAAGLALCLFILWRSLAWIKALKAKYTYNVTGQLKIYNTDEPGTPFSFFRSIFWNNSLSLQNRQGQQIFRHEMFHVKEKHSADILLLEILCCAGWFNPFFHLIKKELKAIHEFLADEYAVSANNRYEYAELLVLHAIHHKAPAIAHPFFHNQIKRRITMITQSNLVRRSGYISRIMALPLLFLLFSAFAVKLIRKPVNFSPYHANKKMTVVIDAGHGGIFPGANTIGMAEKDINLQISQKINQLSAEYNVSVVLTRNNDKLVGDATNLREDLQNRIKISDQANPDLFISIHVNQGLEKNTIFAGFEAYISKRSEAEKTRQFASVILGELKNIYATDETIKQRDQGIVVIDRKTYPSILLECGYLNNPKDLAFITDPSGQEKIARKILEGIVKYSNAQVADSSGASVGNGGANHDTAINTALTEQKSKTEVIDVKLFEEDTISTEALNKINPDDIRSLTVDSRRDLVVISFKNGDTKYAHAKDMINLNRKDTVPANVIFTKVEFEPDYPGGSAGWVKYLTQHLKYPDAAVKKKIEGTVLMEFIVNTDGTLADIKAISGPEELKQPSIRAIKESGVWIAAKQNGKKVRAYKRQPITYKLA